MKKKVKKEVNKKSVKKPVKKKASKKKSKKPTKKVPKKKTVNKVKNKSIKSTKKLSKRIPSGIVGLDKIIGGGFSRNSINLVLGGSGAGKSIFAMQFLMQGIKKGEHVLYISFEESKKQFFKNMLELGWNLEKLEASGKLIFLEYSPQKVKMMLDEGGGSIETIVYKNKVKRMVMDSVSSFSVLFDTPSSKRQGIISLFDIIRKWDLTTLFTLQKDPLKSKNKPTSQAEIQSDSIILLYLKKMKNQRNRFIEIIKMRSTNHSHSVHPLEMKKNGISVSSRTAKVDI